MNLESFTKTKIDVIEEKLRSICRSLEDSQGFDEDNVIAQIRSYLKECDKVYYYIVTNWCYTHSDDESIDTVVYNCARLYEHITANPDMYEDGVHDFIKHFYDHVNLAALQYKRSMESVKAVKELNEEISEKQNHLDGSMRKYESNSITILGIFSAIVISITGVLSFSSSMLSSIDSVSASRLFCTGSIILIAFLAVISTLTDLIKSMHDSNARKGRIPMYVWIAIIVSIAILGCLPDIIRAIKG